MKLIWDLTEETGIIKAVTIFLLFLTTARISQRFFFHICLIHTDISTFKRLSKMSASLYIFPALVISSSFKILSISSWGTAPTSSLQHEPPFLMLQPHTQRYHHDLPTRPVSWASHILNGQNTIQFQFLPPVSSHFSLSFPVKGLFHSSCGSSQKPGS